MNHVIGENRERIIPIGFTILIIFLCMSQYGLVKHKKKKIPENYNNTISKKYNVRNLKNITKKN